MWITSTELILILYLSKRHLDELLGYLQRKSYLKSSLIGAVNPLLRQIDDEFKSIKELNNLFDILVPKLC